ncbi:unnamed protein product [Didymodactylos carnosus]|uniref:Uncharacterized protein n=1 Tax=Didymodactylos carnosus TaxID=1234261 RepID=A0A815N7Z8_9BILA|nr:unnamed protein product [Didymodactylos carnosus]CAF1433858.1 unnamed protein product [Didymodactylos carnosus]CAF4046092.1 unnamed protein product [Didymodactylos carnosus]CAF4311907.1 unnamed protein product [Didymodactylos carnosus]
MIAMRYPPASTSVDSSKLVQNVRQHLLHLMWMQVTAHIYQRNTVVPKLSVAQKLWIDAVPDELKDLTIPE